MEIPCYNRSCGKTFIDDPDLRSPEECQFHPGAPCFHDAYKEWTCCGKKSTDFTEWLNFPGCTKGTHSNVKPVEPEKITGNLNKDDADAEKSLQENQDNKSRISHEQMLKSRPDFGAPMVRLKPNVAKSLKDELEKNPLLKSQEEIGDDADEIKVGEPCKNGGCKTNFSGEPSLDNAETCQHHPGVPIFHEGMKYWSCCQKKTSDFQSFLNQVGCTTDKHKWIKEQTSTSNDVQCRFDWHQTAEKVTVAIYAKKFDPNSSYLEANPVRLKVHIFFPEQGGSFDLDLNLGGVINVKASTVSMFKTKIEIQLKKADPGSWVKLEMPKTGDQTKKIIQTVKAEEKVDSVPVAKVDALDLDDIEVQNTKWGLSKEAATPKY